MPPTISGTLGPGNSDCWGQFLFPDAFAPTPDAVPRTNLTALVIDNAPPKRFQRFRFFANAALEPSQSRCLMFARGRGANAGPVELI
jgi:hypothetical protein